MAIRSSGKPPTHIQFEDEYGVLLRLEVSSYTLADTYSEVISTIGPAKGRPVIRIPYGCWMTVYDEDDNYLYDRFNDVPFTVEPSITLVLTYTFRVNRIGI